MVSVVCKMAQTAMQTTKTAVSGQLKVEKLSVNFGELCCADSKCLLNVAVVVGIKDGQKEQGQAAQDTKNDRRNVEVRFVSVERAWDASDMVQPALGYQRHGPKDEGQGISSDEKPLVSGADV